MRNYVFARGVQAYELAVSAQRGEQRSRATWSQSAIAFFILRTEFIREAVQHVRLSQPLLPASYQLTTLGIGSASLNGSTLGDQARSTRSGRTPVRALRANSHTLCTSRTTSSSKSGAFRARWRATTSFQLETTRPGVPGAIEAIARVRTTSCSTTRRHEAGLDKLTSARRLGRARRRHRRRRFASTLRSMQC
jgi:hypothetical protein